MHSLLTYYDEKLHLKTVWNEGYEARQEEVDELKNANIALNATIQDKDAALADKDAEIKELKRQLAEVK